MNLLKSPLTFLTPEAQVGLFKDSFEGRILIHDGSTSQGHYFAIRRHDGVWYILDSLKDGPVKTDLEGVKQACAASGVTAWMLTERASVTATGGGTR